MKSFAGLGQRALPEAAGRQAGRFLEAGTRPGAGGVLWEASLPGRTYPG